MLIKNYSMEVDGFEVVETESDDSVSMETKPGRSYEYLSMTQHQSRLTM